MAFINLAVGNHDIVVHGHVKLSVSVSRGDGRMSHEVFDYMDWDVVS